jgi:hypothetical protein
VVGSLPDSVEGLFIRRGPEPAPDGYVSVSAHRAKQLAAQAIDTIGDPTVHPDEHANVGAGSPKAGRISRCSARPAEGQGENDAPCGKRNTRGDRYAFGFDIRSDDRRGWRDLLLGH